MNREIKFRAWRKRDNGELEMFYSDDVSDADTWDAKLCYFFDVGFYDDEPVMQFTGLKDKNGKEIYEGDILYGGHPLGMETRVVEWENECAEFTTPGFEEDYTIIGNIYENPELLK
jgi:uncharacterized phage protein (TIGR01671 family)